MTNKKSTKKQIGLGRGLGALLGQTEQDFQTESQVIEKIVNLDIDEIAPNKDQPRKIFDAEKLSELTASIKEHGILQPIIVTKKSNPDYYMIIAGERRWRAAKEAGLKNIPAIIRDIEDHQIIQHSIIENIQRENLNPVEEAQAYQNLITQYNMTQEELADKLGKSRSAIANTLRLNRLPKSVLEQLEKGLLTAGHARSLLSLDTEEAQIAAAEIILTRALSVRQTEEYIQKLLAPKKKSTPKRNNAGNAYSLSVKKIENDLSKTLGTKVRLKDHAGKGKIEINYANNNELERILELLI